MLLNKLLAFRQGMWLCFLFQIILAPPATARAGEPEKTKEPMRIIVFGAHPDDCELEAGGTAARWSKLGLQGQVRQRDQRRHRASRAGRGDPGSPPNGRGQEVCRDPGNRDRGARHPRRRAAADAWRIGGPSRGRSASGRPTW